MIGWFWKLLVGSFHSCQHEWKIVGECNVVDDSGTKVAYKFYQQCTKCGDLKSKVV